MWHILATLAASGGICRYGVLLDKVLLKSVIIINLSHYQWQPCTHKLQAGHDHWTVNIIIVWDKHSRLASLIPSPVCCSLVCIQLVKERERRGGLNRNTYHVTRTQGGHRGAGLTTNSCAINHRACFSPMMLCIIDLKDVRVLALVGWCNLVHYFQSYSHSQSSVSSFWFLVVCKNGPSEKKLAMPLFITVIRKGPKHQLACWWFTTYLVLVVVHRRLGKFSHSFFSHKKYSCF